MRRTRVPKYLYQLIDRDGDVVFEGTLQDIAEQYETSAQNVYYYYVNFHHGKLLGEYDVRRKCNRTIVATRKQLRDALLVACELLSVHDVNDTGYDAYMWCGTLLDQVSNDE